ncbi:MAG TPA: TIGR01777 family oxidoreductase [Bryobacteraceae bacterium]|nr:TIGR01777 family oxidoreductase [Bryobacteraceae bacterium]
MIVAITGASGMIGKALRQRLAASGHMALAVPRGAGPPACHAVVNLSGEPVAQRWTAAAKKRIYDSRVEGTRRLVSALATQTPRPSVLVCASAIGIFGSRGDEILTETSAPGSGFLPGVVMEWENATQSAEPLGIRAVSIRFGVVLGHGGALARLLPLFRVGAGGRLASGRQWMSWIHIDDAVSLILFAIENAALRGPVNATAPNPVTNADFTRTLARTLHRPAIFPAPAFALKLALGEMSQVLLDSQRVLPAAAQAAGFKFRYPGLTAAFGSLLAAGT